MIENSKNNLQQATGFRVLTKLERFFEQNAWKHWSQKHQRPWIWVHDFEQVLLLGSSSLRTSPVGLYSTTKHDIHQKIQRANLQLLSVEQCCWWTWLMMELQNWISWSPQGRESRPVCREAEQYAWDATKNNPPQILHKKTQIQNSKRHRSEVRGQRSSSPTHFTYCNQHKKHNTQQCLCFFCNYCCHYTKFCSPLWLHTNRRHAWLLQRHSDRSIKRIASWLGHYWFMGHFASDWFVGTNCNQFACSHQSHSLTRCPIFSRARTRSPLGWSQHPFTYLVWSAETGIVCSWFLAAMPSSFQQWLVLLIQNKPEKRRGGGGSSVRSASFWSSCFPPCLLPFPHLSWTLSSIVSGKALEI